MILEQNNPCAVEVLDLSKRDTIDNISSDELFSILNEFSTEKISFVDSESIENVLCKIGSKLRWEESISMVLLSMKESQLRCQSRVAHVPLIESTVDDRFDKGDKCGNEQWTIKDEVLHLSVNVARKLLDHQFVTRQKMIHTQMEKALYDIPVKRQHYKVDTCFVPALSNDFLPLMGLSEVVDSLKSQGCVANESDSCFDKSVICVDCGTGAAPMWKRRKMDDNMEQIICSVCSDKRYQTQVRQEYEDQILRTKYQFEDQEKSLIRDYNDMLSSPRKLELFRQEQEKKQRLQNATVHRTAIGRPIQLSRAPGQKTTVIRSVNDALNADTIVQTASPNRPLKLVTVVTPQTIRDLATVIQSSEGDGTQNQSSYVKMIQALSSQASNPQVTLDQDNVRKLQQVLTMLQSNPLLANNNVAVLQLLSNVCGLQNINGATNSAHSNTASVNSTIAMLNYLVNALVSQQPSPSTNNGAINK